MRLLLSAVLFTLVVSVIGCDVIAETQLENAVKQALADDPRTSSYSFDVSVHDDGSVLITGEIFKPEEFAIVTEIAEGVEGVGSVLNRTSVPDDSGGGMMQDHVVPSPFL